jgi:hypothetical protein
MATTPPETGLEHGGGQTGGAGRVDGHPAQTSPPEPSGRPAQTAHARIASSVPGRVRVRVRHPRRHPRLMQHAEDRLREQAGVGAVETNPVTGSVVVRYDPQQRSTHEILDVLRDLGVIIGDVAHAEDELPGGDAGDRAVAAAIGPVGHSQTALTMVDAVDDLNQRLHRFTGGVVDLKVLFPLSLGAIGVTKVLRDGLQLGDIPGYVLLWYAFDAFYKLHRQPPDHLVNTATMQAAEHAGAAHGQAAATDGGNHAG